MKPRLSVVIPYFNAPESLFSDCVKSIRNQEFDSYEVIVVDDGSCEESASFLDRAVGCDERFSVFHELPKGVSEARNKGLSIAKGDYVTFVDADDRVAPGFFSEAVRLLDSTGAEAAYAKIRRLYPKGTSSEPPFALKSGSLILENAELAAFKRLIVAGSCPTELGYLNGFDAHTVAAKVYSRRLLQGLLFSSDLKWGEDSLFNNIVAGKAIKIAICDSVWYEYVYHSASATHKPFDELLSELRDFRQYIAAARTEGWNLGDVGMRWMDAALFLLDNAAHDLRFRELAHLTASAVKGIDADVINLIDLSDYALSRYQIVIRSLLARSDHRVAAALLKAKAFLRKERQVGGGASD